MREEFNASRFSTEPTKLHAPTHPFTEFSHFLSLMPWNTFCVSLRFAFSKYLRKIRFLPPPLSTLRYMGKNSVRLNWSNARKLTTSSGKKIPRFFAEKKKSYPSKVTPCASWRAIFSILRHIEYDSTLGFVFLLTPVCPVLSLSEIYRHVIAFHPVGSNSNRRFNVSIQ